VRTHEIGGLEDRAPRAGIGLVHRPPRRHEHRHSSGTQTGDGPGDEIIMQGQAKASQLVRAPDRAVAERRVADHQIVAFRQLGCRKIFSADPLVRKQLARDAGRQRVVLDRRPSGFRGQLRGHACHEKPGATARFQRTAAPEPHLGHQIPHRMNDQFVRVVGVLRGPCQTRSLLLAGQGFKLAADLFPTGTEGLSGTREQAVGQLSGPEPCETGEHGLLFRAGVAVFRFQCGQKADRCQIVAGALFPALGEATRSAQDEIHFRQDGGDRSRGLCRLSNRSGGFLKGAVSGKITPVEIGLAAAEC